jgi:uncharacterized damage-inducible protein DinB
MPNVTPLQTSTEHMRDLFALMASYNTWMNAKLYRTASELSADELCADRGAFFGSVLGTLNHIVVADRIWLQRFADHSPQRESLSAVRDLPRPRSLNEILFSDLNELSEHRTMLDGAIERWAQSLSDPDLSQLFCYTTLKGDRVCKRYSGLVLHFFNHQTHHRGQVTTLLSQFGRDVGVTDLWALVPIEDQA